MNKKAYQQPTTSVVKLQHKSHILAGSVNDVKGNANLRYGGEGTVDANSRRGGWDDDDE